MYGCPFRGMGSYCRLYYRHVAYSAKIVPEENPFIKTILQFIRLLVVADLIGKCIVDLAISEVLDSSEVPVRVYIRYPETDIYIKIPRYSTGSFCFNLSIQLLPTLTSVEKIVISLYDLFFVSWRIKNR